MAKNKRRKVLNKKPISQNKNISVAPLKTHHYQKTASIWYASPLLIFIVSKLLIISAILISFYYFDDLHQINLWNRWYSGQSILDAWYIPFANWDGQHYLLLADYGYNHWQHSQAFFPLYPILIKLFTLVINDFYWSALLLVLVLSYGVMVFFYQYARYYLPDNKALLALLLFIAYPSAFYLSVFYSEALFLFLLFAFLYFYDVKKSYLSLWFILLMPLTRGQAAFIPIALAIIILLRYFKKEKIDYRYEISQFIAFAVGAFCYLLFFKLTTGSLWSGISAQKGFVFNNSLLNIINPVHFLDYLLSATKGLFSYTNGLIDKIFIIISILGIGLVVKSKNILWIVFYIMMFYPVSSMGAGGSFIRFSLLSMPFLILAWLSSRIKNYWVNYYIIGLFVIVQLYFIYRFSLNEWIG